MLKLDTFIILAFSEGSKFPLSATTHRKPLLPAQSQHAARKWEYPRSRESFRHPVTAPTPRRCLRNDIDALLFFQLRSLPMASKPAAAKRDAKRPRGSSVSEVLHNIELRICSFLSTGLNFKRSLRADQCADPSRLIISCLCRSHLMIERTQRII